MGLIRAFLFCSLLICEAGCLSYTVGTGVNLWASNHEAYEVQCVRTPSPAPSWCDEAKAAQDELMAANKAASVVVSGSKTPQRDRLKKAIKRDRAAFKGH